LEYLAFQGIKKLRYKFLGAYKIFHYRVGKLEGGWIVDDWIYKSIDPMVYYPPAAALNAA
jgi:hypothetical protein